MMGILRKHYFGISTLTLDSLQSTWYLEWKLEGKLYRENIDEIFVEVLRGFCGELRIE